MSQEKFPTFNPIRTGHLSSPSVFSEHVLVSGGVFFTSSVYSFVFKPGKLKFDMKLKIDKIYHKKQD